MHSEMRNGRNHVESHLSVTHAGLTTPFSSAHGCQKQEDASFASTDAHSQGHAEVAGNNALACAAALSSREEVSLGVTVTY